MINLEHLKTTLKLAKLGESEVFPNPMVGCVIVHEKNNSVVGQGFHQKYGEAHAEVNAIADAKKYFESNAELQKQYKNTYDFFKECTVYVSLEPCAHHGKTPPCAELIIKNNFGKLVYASKDPNPNVSGKGTKKIAEAGIKIIGTDELRLLYANENFLNKASYINRAFYKWITQKKPWITLKIASTSDGRMITRDNEPKWITNSNSRQLVHRMRSTHQLLITGINTVLKDNPQFTVRYSPAELGLHAVRQPDIAILKSSQEFIDKDRDRLQLLQKFIINDTSSQKQSKAASNLSCENFSHNQRSIREFRILNEFPRNDIRTSDNDFANLHDFINAMSEEAYNKIMIESGPTLSGAFLKEGLVDEIVHFEPIFSSIEETVDRVTKRYREGTFLNGPIPDIAPTKYQCILKADDDTEKDVADDVVINFIL